MKNTTNVVTLKTAQISPGIEKSTPDNVGGESPGEQTANMKSPADQWLEELMQSGLPPEVKQVVPSVTARLEDERRACLGEVAGSLDGIVHSAVPPIWHYGGKRNYLICKPISWEAGARDLVKMLDLNYFFSPGNGLVEVAEEPLFGGWRCSPVSVPELAKVLRKRVVLLEHVRALGDWHLEEVDHYDRFAKVLAGYMWNNGYFPYLKGMVFSSHMTNDGRVLNRRGFDKRSGFFVMGRAAFKAANDEPMAVAA